MTAGVLATLVGSGLIAGVYSISGTSPSSVESVGTEAPVTALDQGLGLSNNSPVILSDPTDPRFVVLANRLDAPEFSCALHVSGDAGRGWVPAVPVPELPAGADTCYAPEVAFDGQGVLYYLFVGLSGAGNEPMGVFLTTSTDRARTFSLPRQVLGPQNYGVRMAIDQSFGRKGRLHLAWLHATSDPPLGGFGPPPNPILAAYSDDSGATFSAPVQVNDPAHGRVVAPALALGPGHAVHVGYFDLKDDVRDYQGLEGPTWEGTWSLLVSSSSDGGDHFGPGQIVDDSVVPSERVMLIFTMPPPSLVAHGNGLCVAWTDARHGDPDAFLRCSDDGRDAWEGPVRLNDDPLGSGHRQYLPRLSVASNGRLDAIFYDRRIDPQNIRNDVYYTFSVDGGRRFTRNVKLTQESSDSRIGQQYLTVSAQGQYEFGSRLGLLSQPSGAIAVWSDTRHSLPPPRSPGQDLFAAQVRLSATTGLLFGGRLVGFTLLFVGGCLLLIASFRLRSGAVPSRRRSRQG